MAINITQKNSTTNTTYLANRSLLYIVWHYTAGVTSKKGAALDTASVVQNPPQAALTGEKGREIILVTKKWPLSPWFYRTLIDGTPYFLRPFRPNRIRTTAL